jgi:hypothetical protein
MSDDAIQDLPSAIEQLRQELELSSRGMQQAADRLESDSTILMTGELTFNATVDQIAAAGILPDGQIQALRTLFSSSIEVAQIVGEQRAIFEQMQTDVARHQAQLAGIEQLARSGDVLS